MSHRALTEVEMREREHRFELVISALLRIGVSVSSVVILTGMALVFIRYPNYMHSRSDLLLLIRPGAAGPIPVKQLLAGLRAGSGRAVISLGLILLIATPVLRVAVSIGGFVYQRDRAYVGITSVVLALLLLSLVLGKAG